MDLKGLQRARLITNSRHQPSTRVSLWCCVFCLTALPVILPNRRRTINRLITSPSVPQCNYIVVCETVAAELAWLAARMSGRREPPFCLPTGLAERRSARTTCSRSGPFYRSSGRREKEIERLRRLAESSAEEVGKHVPSIRQDGTTLHLSARQTATR